MRKKWKKVVGTRTPKKCSFWRGVTADRQHGKAIDLIREYLKNYCYIFVFKLSERL